MNRPLGVYVHFPWCLAKCPYCDFVSYVAASPIDHAGYADQVIRELEARRRLFSGLPGRRLASVFFGGGTPSLWETSQLGRVLGAVLGVFGESTGEPSASGIEVTVECNPTSLDAHKAEALLEAGVNRLSIGVQSLNDERLRFLGRLHDVRGAKQALLAARQAGIARVSSDLIFGLPGQAAADARDEALELADLGLAHVSCYQLTIEPGTRFGELARRGRLPLAEDEEVAHAFLAIHEALQGRGLEHYEVSNYARGGQEAAHNLGYWRGDEYLGLGCGAYGFVRLGPGGGMRWRNKTLPEEYLGSDSVSSESEFLDDGALLRERIMLGLRLVDGVDFEQAAADLGVENAWTSERTRAARWLEERHRIVRDGPRVRIPPAAWLWADDTAARLM
jgi:putative oxygen-independent coproporphyrinogen III oxidase